MNAARALVLLAVLAIGSCVAQPAFASAWAPDILSGDMK